MQKKHVLPEFQVIVQNEANAKFFVASFDNTQSQPGGTRTTSDQASSYSSEETVDDLW